MTSAWLVTSDYSNSQNDIKGENLSIVGLYATLEAAECGALQVIEGFGPLYSVGSINEDQPNGRGSLFTRRYWLTWTLMNEVTEMAAVVEIREMELQS